MSIKIITGDCRDVLRTLPDESVHCVITSPPYYGLRDYGTAQWEGGDPRCAHIERATRGDSGRPSCSPRPCFEGKPNETKQQFKNICGKCGARRIDSQIGLERSLGEYVETMVAVFRDVRRVLRKDGTLWLNMGDSYAASVNGRSAADTKALGNDDRTFRDKPFSTIGSIARPGHDGHGGFVATAAARNRNGLAGFDTGYLKPKDLCGIPWRVAFALQADGWWLRQDIIWAKPNPMPESVTDRCTKAHEYLFLLTKAERYYYDAEAIKENVGEETRRQKTFRGGCYTNNTAFDNSHDYAGHALYSDGEPSLAGRNKRSVWEIATAPFSEAHFATFPPALIEPCIKAGTSEKGCCAKCGKPWRRETGRNVDPRQVEPSELDRFGNGSAGVHRKIGNAYQKWMEENPKQTLGWSPSCECGAEVVPATILDPFSGAGTTGLVADRLGRNAILIELNPQYAAMAERRIQDDAPLFADVGGYDGNDDFAKSYEECLAAIRERVAEGGSLWQPAEPHQAADDGPLFAWVREAAK